MTPPSSAGCRIITAEDCIKAGIADLPQAVNVVKDAIRMQQGGRAILPDKTCIIYDAHTQARTNILPAVLLAKKVSGMKWVSVFPENPAKWGIPNVFACTVLSDLDKGYVKAVFDSTFLSNLRVAAVTAIAAEYLAPRSPETFGIIGAGYQALFQVLAFKTIKPSIREVRVYCPTEAHMRWFSDRVTRLFPDLRVEICANAESSIRNADIVATATSAQEPLLKLAWMKKGFLYSHVAGYEDEYAVALNSDKIVVDDWKGVKKRGQTIARMYHEGMLSDASIYAELSDLISGSKPGRSADDENIYFNSVGVGLFDVALAQWALESAESAGVGTVLDWFSYKSLNHPLL